MPGDTNTQEQVQEQPKQEEVKQETQETQETTEDPTAKMAMDLYNSLNDPTRAGEVVKFLAARAGLKIQEDEVTPKAATKETIEELKNGIDPNLHFLVDGLKPAIEKMINSRVEAALNPVKQAQLQDRETQVMSQINTAYDVMRG